MDCEETGVPADSKTVRGPNGVFIVCSILLAYRVVYCSPALSMPPKYLHSAMCLGAKLYQLNHPVLASSSVVIW